MKTLLLAGGGSGGHISPGLAIAERMNECCAGDSEPPRIHFVCSERAIDRQMLAAAKARFETVPARPPSLHPARFIDFARRFAASRRIVRRLLVAENVGHVVALGGFVAAPVASAARAEGVALTLLNLDDPPGRANRWIARRATRVWSAVPTPAAPGFRVERVTGLPVRRCAIAPASPQECRERLGLDPGRPTLLVTGASQGSAAINDLLEQLVTGEGSLFAGWQIVHLCGGSRDGGHERRDSLRRAYRAAGVGARVEEFLDEVGLAWGAADLAITRAGANSVAEALANAVPAVFLPYPHHRDRHQERNARPVVEAGGAVIVEEVPDRNRTRAALRSCLAGLLSAPARLREMRDRLRAARPADAALIVARELLSSLGR